MVKWSMWSYIFVLISLTASSSNLQTDLGMKLEQRPKRPLSGGEDDRQMVTIDLSALRPSLPGLVLYKYGDVAPKLVQVDLSALNPQLQPHVIWPQFDQIDLLNDRSFDFDSMDAIPYLADDESLISPRYQKMAKMSMSMSDQNPWGDIDDISDEDIYDFIPDTKGKSSVMSLHGSLPLADEVIVPLDWEEEKTSRNSAKRNVFMSRGWQPGGGLRGIESTKEKNISPEPSKATQNFNIHYTPFGTTNWIPGKRKQDRETESEEMKDDQKPTTVQVGKKNVFVSSGWGPGGQQAPMAGARRLGNRRRIDNKPRNQPVRISSQESWSVPRQYWSVPHLLGSHWQ